MKRAVVIGGGILGLSVALKLTRRYPDCEVIVVEKEHDVGRHQSGNNSGVLHAGVFYKPGSLKAKLSVDGIRQMTAFCEEYKIPYDVCGKLIIATNAEEHARLEDLRKRGVENGLSGLALLSRDEMREREPFAEGVGALLVPEEGIVSFLQVCRKLAELIESANGSVKRDCMALELQSGSGRWMVGTTENDYLADVVINCAGLYSDRVCRLSGEKSPAQIIPFRGEYYRIRKDRRHLVRHLIYPVPDPRYPFLGVHFTKKIRGEVEAGPNAVLAFCREGYQFGDFYFQEFWESITYPGLWKFVTRNSELCMSEFSRSMNINEFCKSLQKLVPEIRPEDLERAGAGVRAQAMLADGRLVQDFLFIRRRGILHVLNAPSPGATASLAIADELINQIGDELA